jgi:hypothetical protein
VPRLEYTIFYSVRDSKHALYEEIVMGRVLRDTRADRVSSKRIPPTMGELPDLLFRAVSIAGTVGHVLMMNMGMMSIPLVCIR